MDASKKCRNASNWYWKYKICVCIYLFVLQTFFNPLYIPNENCKHWWKKLNQLNWISTNKKLWAFTHKIDQIMVSANVCGNNQRVYLCTQGMNEIETKFFWYWFDIYQ